MPEVAPDDIYVTAQQTADLLGVSLRTVEYLRASGLLTPVYLPTTGRRKARRFKRADIEARIAEANGLTPQDVA